MSALTPAVSAWLAAPPRRRHTGRPPPPRPHSQGQIDVAHPYRRPRALRAIACTGWLGHPRPPSRPWPWPARSLLTSWCPSARPLVCGACVGWATTGPPRHDRRPRSSLDPGHGRTPLASDRRRRRRGPETTASASRVRRALSSTSRPGSPTSGSTRSSSSSSTAMPAPWPRCWRPAGGCGERGRPGSARFARVLSERPDWLKPVGSDLELRLERALLAAGVPRPERQAEVRLRGGQLVHPDFLWRPEGEALEVDHVTFHGGKLDQYYDKWRDRQLRLVGIHVTRVTDQDIAERLEAVVAEVAAILAASRARTAS